jgi:hypothetical protein
MSILISIVCTIAISIRIWAVQYKYDTVDLTKAEISSFQDYHATSVRNPIAIMQQIFEKKTNHLKNVIFKSKYADSYRIVRKFIAITIYLQHLLSRLSVVQL